MKSSETSPRLGKPLFSGVRNQASLCRMINGPLIIAQDQCLQNRMNNNLHNGNKSALTFSAKWVARFKRWWNSKSSRKHGESGNLNIEAMKASLPQLVANVNSYKVRDIFNADEYDLFYKLAPDHTIAQNRQPGRKVSK